MKTIKLLKKIVKLFSVTSFLVCSYCFFINVFAAPEVITDETGQKIMTVDREAGLVEFEPIQKGDLSFLRTENSILEDRRTYVLRQKYPDFLPNIVTYKNVKYEYHDGGIVVATGAPTRSSRLFFTSTKPPQLYDECIAVLGVMNEWQEERSLYHHELDSSGCRVTVEEVIQKENIIPAKRPFNELRIVGPFEGIPDYFLCDYKAKTSIKSMYMDKTQIKQIGDAFNGIVSNDLTHISFPTTLKRIFHSTISTFERCPNLNPEAKNVLLKLKK